MQGFQSAEWLTLFNLNLPAIPQAISIEVPAASISYTGYAPDFANNSLGTAQPTFLSDNIGQVTTNGITTFVNVGAQRFTATDAQVINVPAASVTYAGLAPNAFAGVTIPREGVWNAYLDRRSVHTFNSNIITLPNDAVLNYITVRPGLTTVTYSGIAPEVRVSASVSIEPPTGTYGYTGLVPTVEASNPFSVTVPVASVTYTGQVPNIGIANDFSVEVPAAAVTYTGLEPTVSTSTNTVIEIPTASVSYIGLESSVVIEGGATITVPSGQVTYLGLAPRVEGDFDFSNSENFEYTPPDLDFELAA